MLLTVLYIIGITAEAMTGALAAGRRKWICSVSSLSRP